MTTSENNTEAQDASPEKGSDKEYNFQQLRKQLDSERQARMQAEEKAKKFEEETQRRASSQSEDDEDEDDDPYVDRRHLDKRFKKWEMTLEEKMERKAEEKARSLLNQERQQSYMKQHEDFNEIMQPDMLQKFIDKHPGLAEGILSMPEGFERQKLVYENIKALGINKKEEAPSVQDKINQNRRSPYYQPSGVGTSPYQGAGDFSNAGKKSAYDKMQDLKKRLRI